MKKVILKKGEEAEIFAGRPIIFDNEIERAEDVACEKGECTGICQVFSKGGLFVGVGFFNDASKIKVRLLSKETASKETLQSRQAVAALLAGRVADACLSRKKIFGNSSCRLVFSESDGISGFIADKFVDNKGGVHIVVSFNSLLCSTFKQEIIAALQAAQSPVEIIERSDSRIQEKEGIVSAATQATSKFVISENAILYAIDFATAQKTGHYLDQRENRFFLRRFCNGASVLDCFCNTGGFSLNAIAGGAKSVIAVDASQDALDTFNKNVVLNNLQGKAAIQTICDDAFEVLRKLCDEGAKFDVVILDPPPFAKSAKDVSKAYGGYKEINYRALRLLNSGGILCTSSCSHFFHEDKFFSVLQAAASDCHSAIKVLSKRGAPSDHPVLLGFNNTEYLKCVVAQIFRF